MHCENNLVYVAFIKFILYDCPLNKERWKSEWPKNR